ncbi:hypothetical protein [Streptomyces sp. NPDC005969]|uniref:hypothetical protein n=1 Tax=Streptomyces sp. NPDC005969 TaxID=3156722 RepID=UPI00340E8706
MSPDTSTVCIVVLLGDTSRTSDHSSRAAAALPALAANASFGGTPILASLLAWDRHVPHVRGAGAGRRGAVLDRVFRHHTGAVICRLRFRIEIPC